MTDAYPLRWPDGWPRTSAAMAELNAAINDAREELR